MTDERPSVSVIIPAWNEEATIGAQLEALARQEGAEPLEIIVSDNGSTDGTYEVVRGYETRLPQLRWIVADAVSGPSHARNEAAKIAEGEILAFCDADDVVDEHWLRALVEGLEVADFVGGSLDTRRLNDAEVRVWREIDLSSSHGARLPKAVTSNMAIRRDAFHELGMFDEDFVWGHDHEFAYRAHLEGHRFAFVPSAVVHYRIKDSLRDLLRREYQDWVGAAHVYAKYRGRGAERQSVWEAIKVAIWLVLHALDLRERRTAGRWLRKAAGLVGRFRGSLRYRVLYP